MASTKEDHLKDAISVLAGALSDKDVAVNNSVIKSLNKIANDYPNEVLKQCCEIQKGDIRLDQNHLANIIKVLEQTCVNHIKKLTPECAEDLVDTMMAAMTGPHLDPAIHLGSSAVLVAVGHAHLDLVLSSLIKQLTPTSVPHFTIPHTLGTLAAINTQGIVPHIKEILSKMLPLLTMIKADNLRQAFSYAFGHFAVAVSEQIGDNVENDNITSIKENFVVEFSIIFDVLFSQWLHSHEPKVAECVLEALGPITRLISEKKFDETVNKFVMALLNMYRRPNLNPYFITQCISYLLTPSPLNPKLSLNDNVLAAINHSMFSMVVSEPDYDQPQTVKNHFEVLRCFDHMACQFPDNTIENLLQQCKNNQEKERTKAVIVLTHLTTSSQIFIEKYAPKFVVLLKIMISMEQGLKMKKVLVKAIVGLVYRNGITNADDFKMVEFIIRHCGFENANAGSIEINELQDTCRSSLILMCNTVTSVRMQLKNLLLDSLTIEEMSGSISTATYCLTNLLQNTTEIIPEEQAEKLVEVKSTPELIFVRCLVFLIDPAMGKRNKNILLFLEEYSSDIHRNLKTSWNLELQRLLKYVDKDEPKEQWHAMLKDLLVAAIEQVNNNKWLELISMNLSNQILTTRQSTEVKGISLQFLAILTCHMSNVAIVEKMLNVILLAIKSIPIDGCPYVSKAVGIASRQHGEFILNQLDAIFKEIEAKRSSKFLNFISSKHSKTEVEVSIVKYAVIMCYGAVAHDTLDVHVLARLSDNTAVTVYDVLKTNPAIDLSRACITTLYEIARALQPAPHHTVALRNRWQLLNVVLEQLYNSNLDKKKVELYPIIVKASKELTKLQRGILPEERNTILRLLFNSILGELSHFKAKYETEGNDPENDVLAKTLNESLNLLHDLIRELVIQAPCLSMIDDFISLIMEWLVHDNEEIRTASVLILHVLFDAYIKNVKLNYETPSKFGQMGYLLGLLVPGSADTNFAVRLSTIDCVKLIIQIQDLYEGITVDPNDSCMNQLTQISNNILTNDLNMIAEYSVSLSETICDKIPHNHIMQFIESILDSFDESEFRTTGISAILEALVKKKGTDLFQNIERIVEVVLETMDRINGNVKLKLLKVISTLAHHHSNAVTAVLLSQSLPLKPCVVSCWHYLAQDESLATSILDNFIRLMTSVELFEDPYHITENHIAALQPLTLMSALGEMLQQESMRPLCVARFADMFSVLYTTLACYAVAAAPAYTLPPAARLDRFGFIPNRDAARLSPAAITVHTFNAFLTLAGCDKVREACSVFSGSEGGSFLELCPVVGGALCRQCPQHVTRLVGALAPYARSRLPPHRAATLTLFAELLNYRCNENEVVVESVMACLLGGAKDQAGGVRAAALRGLAHVARLHAEPRARYLPRVLHALSQAVDAESAPEPAPAHAHASARSGKYSVPLAALQGLCRLLSETETVDAEHHRELLSVSLKVKPFMNTDEPLLREHSIRLFGIIAHKIRSESLTEQAVASLPCFMLHLCDENPAVVRACKFTLKRVFSTLNVKKSNDMVQTHLVDEGKLYIEEFLSDLWRQLAEELPRALPPCIHAALAYLHAGAGAGAGAHIRPYAPLLMGTLYHELRRVRNNSKDFDPDEEVTANARTRLAQLVRDGNGLVRQHAAVALANVCLVSAEDS